MPVRVSGEEADRIAGVVRHAERVHAHVADFKARPGGEQAELELRSELRLDGFLGQPVAVNWNPQFRREDEQPLHMVAVLVRDENAGEGFGRAPDGLEALANLAPAQAGIDEEAGLGGFQAGAIAAGTAAENGEVGRHGVDVRFPPESGQCFFTAAGNCRLAIAPGI